MIRSGWRALAPMSCLVSLALFRIDFRPVVVQGRSMEPTMRDGQIVWMRERRAGDAPLCPGDIVVLRYRNEILVKRIVAVGGEAVRSIQFTYGGSEILEAHGPSAPWTQMMMEHIRRHPNDYRVSEFKVPANCVYVVGDNEPSSWDSRDIGPLPETSVLGVIPMSDSQSNRNLAANPQVHPNRAYAARLSVRAVPSCHGNPLLRLVRTTSAYLPHPNPGAESLGAPMANWYNGIRRTR